MDNLSSIVGASESSTLPGTVAAAGWIAFLVCLVLSFLFSGSYMKYFWNTRESDRCSAVTATFGLFIALLTAYLLPVDIFLISFMKHPNGTFKDWATNATRESVENSIMYSYIVIYCCVLLFLFFLLPLVYFAYEERDEDGMNCSVRFCSALKFTSVILLFAMVLLLLGAFLPFKNVPKKNTTEWERMEFILHELYANKGEDALAFALNVLTVIGMLTLVLYMGFGLSCFPIGMLRGSLNIETEKARVVQRSAMIRSEIEALRHKQLTKRLSARDIATLSKLEEDEHFVNRLNTHIQKEEKGYWHRLHFLFRIFQIFLGAIGLMFGLLLWVSLLLANVDKAINSVGYDIAYITKFQTIPNPLDFVMIKTQAVFPIDYIFFFAIIIFLVMCTISGIRYLGIWCFCVKMYRIRAHRTQPQGLIMLCAILMYTVLALNILVFFAIPQYTMFGNQHYRDFNATTGITEVKQCNLDAPKDECYMTRTSSLILRLSFKAWIFGAAYYWFMWAFLAVSIISFFMSIIGSKTSFLEEAIEKDDFEESEDDERMLVP